MFDKLRERQRQEELHQEDDSIIKTRSRSPDSKPITPPRPPRAEFKSRSSPSQRTRQCRFDEDDREDDSCPVGDNMTHPRAPPLNRQEPLVFIPAGTDLSARVKEINRRGDSPQLTQPYSSADSCDDGESFSIIPTNRSSTGKVLWNTLQRRDSSGNSAQSSDIDSDQSSETSTGIQKQMKGLRLTSPPSVTSPPSAAGRGQLLISLLNKHACTFPAAGSASGSAGKPLQYQSDSPRTVTAPCIDEVAWQAAQDSSYKGPGNTDNDMHSAGRGRMFQPQ